MGFSIGTTGIRSGGPRGTLEQYADKVEGRSFNLRVLWHLLIFVQPYAWRMVAALLAMLIASALTLLVPYLIKVAIDGPIAARDATTLNEIVLLMAAGADWLISGFVGAALSVELGWAESIGGSARRALPPPADAAAGVS